MTLGHFFDFLSTMHAGCPRMAILPSNADLPHLNVIYAPTYTPAMPARWAHLPDEWCAERGSDPAVQTSANLPLPLGIRPDD